MSHAADVLRKGVRKVLLTQAALTLIVAGGFWLAHGSYQTLPQGWRGGLAPELIDMLSALYGGLITMAGTWWLGTRVQRAGEAARANPGAAQLSLYAGALVRFVGTLVLLGIGIGALKLAPIPLIVAFGVAQLGFLANIGQQPQR